MTEQAPAAGAAPALINNDASTELASNRTSLSFERTRMSADRTLMSTVRTSLSLISFGFTIYKVFQSLRTQPGLVLDGAQSARRFGIALLLLGVGLLIAGIVSNFHFTHDLTKRREWLAGEHLLRRTIHYSATPTFVMACLLLLIGLSAVLSILWRTGPLA